jgi:hypothetical protein
MAFAIDGRLVSIVLLRVAVAIGATATAELRGCRGSGVTCLVASAAG